MARAAISSQLARYQAVRACTERLCRPLAPEDCVVQSMPDVSPTRWHIAHVTWFFETFLLKPRTDDYRPVDPRFEYLFNSYYNTVGEQFPRLDRGLLTRPTVAEVLDYRREVDLRMAELIDRSDPDEIAPLIEIGLNHEQQHQELLLMDIKHVFSRNPLWPAYQEAAARPTADPGLLTWHAYPEGLAWIGHRGTGFSFDNESPRHRVFLESFEIGSRPVTNGEYAAFVEDGGYREPRHWLADGWATVEREAWCSPLYWVRDGEAWREFTLGGLVRLDPHAPVCHVSYYEADAFATWSGLRLPTEAEWESAAGDAPIEGNLLEQGALHPGAVLPATNAGADGPQRLFGDVWEWTRSAYSPYPGYRPPKGALGEYNGKFMSNQMVLRGGACVTPADHIRPTYRNFFYPHCRWQFGGIRLAR